MNYLIVCQESEVLPDQYCKDLNTFKHSNSEIKAGLGCQVVDNDLVVFFLSFPICFYFLKVRLFNSFGRQLQWSIPKHISAAKVRNYIKVKKTFLLTMIHLVCSCKCS